MKLTDAALSLSDITGIDDIDPGTLAELRDTGISVVLRNDNDGVSLVGAITGDFEVDDIWVLSDGFAIQNEPTSASIRISPEEGANTEYGRANLSFDVSVPNQIFPVFRQGELFCVGSVFRLP